MTTYLSININSETNRILRWAELERGRSPQEVLQIGTTLLELMTAPGIVEISLIDNAGNVTDIADVQLVLPPDIYDF